MRRRVLLVSASISIVLTSWSAAATSRVECRGILADPQLARLAEEAARTIGQQMPIPDLLRRFTSTLIVLASRNGRSELTRAIAALDTPTVVACVPTIRMRVAAAEEEQRTRRAAEEARARADAERAAAIVRRDEEEQRARRPAEEARARAEAERKAEIARRDEERHAEHDRRIAGEEMERREQRLREAEALVREAGRPLGFSPRSFGTVINTRLRDLGSDVRLTLDACLERPLRCRYVGFRAGAPASEYFITETQVMANVVYVPRSGMGSVVLGTLVSVLAEDAGRGDPVAFSYEVEAAIEDTNRFEGRFADYFWRYARNPRNGKLVVLITRPFD